MDLIALRLSGFALGLTSIHQQSLEKGLGSSVLGPVKRAFGPGNFWVLGLLTAYQRVQCSANQEIRTLKCCYNPYGPYDLRIQKSHVTVSSHVLP